MRYSATSLTVIAPGSGPRFDADPEAWRLAAEALRIHNAAFFDPMMGVLADRTNTRWGKFRPWILFTAVPWCIVMVLAYTTPRGWDAEAMVAYSSPTVRCTVCASPPPVRKVQPGSP